MDAIKTAKKNTSNMIIYEKIQKLKAVWGVGLLLQNTNMTPKKLKFVFV